LSQTENIFDQWTPFLSIKYMQT